MLGRTTHHMRHNVVAYLALFLALSGSAMAARPMITGEEVQDESLTSADVRNDSLTGDDILESSLGKVSSATTAGSATTAADADKLDGKDSTAFLQSVEFARGPEVYVAPGSYGPSVAECPSGTKVTGGGYRLTSHGPAYFKDFRPYWNQTSASESWEVRAYNASDDLGMTFFAVAHCAS